VSSTSGLIKSFLCVPWRCGGVGVNFHSFLTLAVDEGEWSTSQPGHFTLRKRNSGGCGLGG
jgi:hypothetical protein